MKPPARKIRGTAGRRRRKPAAADAAPPPADAPGPSATEALVRLEDALRVVDRALRRLRERD